MQVLEVIVNVRSQYQMRVLDVSVRSYHQCQKPVLDAVSDVSVRSYCQCQKPVPEENVDVIVKGYCQRQKTSSHVSVR